MLAGKLCGDRSVIGRGADASGATVEVVGGVKKEAPSKAKGKVGAADVAARKRPRELDVVSESTDDYDTEVVEEAARPPVCPFGATCFRKNPDHFRQFSHGDAPKAAPASSEKLLAVIAKKRPATAVVEDFLLTTRPVVPVLPTGSPGATKLGARCPHGALCFRNDPKHFVDFDHS
jgi:hypothetical protein